jgi:hypothetical protein
VDVNYSCIYLVDYSVLANFLSILFHVHVNYIYSFSLKHIEKNLQTMVILVVAI